MANLSSQARVVETKSYRAVLGSEDAPVEFDGELLRMTVGEIFRSAGLPTEAGADVTITINGHKPASFEDVVTEDDFEDGTIIITAGSKPKGA